jgi:hypothetical protein
MVHKKSGTQLPLNSFYMPNIKDNKTLPIKQTQQMYVIGSDTLSIIFSNF